MPPGPKELCKDCAVGGQCAASVPPRSRCTHRAERCISFTFWTRSGRWSPHMRRNWSVRAMHARGAIPGHRRALAHYPRSGAADYADGAATYTQWAGTHTALLRARILPSPAQTVQSVRWTGRPRGRSPALYTGIGVAVRHPLACGSWPPGPYFAQNRSKLRIVRDRGWLLHTWVHTGRGGLSHTWVHTGRGGEGPRSHSTHRERGEGPRSTVHT